MDNCEFEKIKRELEELKKQNDEQIATSDEKSRLAMVNSLEFKGLITLFFSLIAYMALFCVSMGLTQKFGSSVITNIFPGFTYPIAVIGSSLGIGIIGRGLLSKKYKTKERFKSFSNAKTQRDKLFEEVHYQIELEKAKNRNKVIDEAIKIIDSNQMMVSSMSNRYDMVNKNSLQSKEQLEKNKEELLVTIVAQYDKLDMLSTKNVLHERFWKVREKFQRRTATLIVPMLSVFVTMLVLGFPLMLIKDIVVSASIVSILPFIVTVVGSTLYMLKRNSDYKKVFNKLNSLLGENAMDEKFAKFESASLEEKEINDLLENQIMNTRISLVELHEIKTYLDTYAKDEEEKEKVLNQLERNVNCDVRTCSEMFYTDDSLEKTFSDKEETLVKKRVLRKK